MKNTLLNMSKLSRTTKFFAVSSLLSSALMTIGVVSSPAFAQTAASTTAAAASSAPMSASAPAAMRVRPQKHRSAASHQDFVDKRLNAMHSELMITSAQSTQWDAFAQTMRDSAANTDAGYKGRADKLATMNADEAMKSYADLAQLHADNTQKLATSFSALYATFSDAQKQNADVMFRNQRAHREAMKRTHKRAPAAAAAPAAASAAASN